jgi:hypothetical protein
MDVTHGDTPLTNGVTEVKLHRGRAQGKNKRPILTVYVCLCDCW